MEIHDDEVDEFLAHFGVKGMKWGVRKDAGHEGERASTRQINRADKKYEKSFAGAKGWVKVHNAMADDINAQLGGLNEKHKNTDLTPGSRGEKAYFRDYEKIVESAALKASAGFGTNASGSKRVKITREGSGYETSWTATFEEIKHANGQPYFKIIPKFNAKGFIVSQEIELVEDNMSQSGIGEEIIDDHFEHVGVKGMKWGVRKAVDATSISSSSRAKRLARLDRVASGTGSRRDKAVVALTEVSAVSNRGKLSENAARRSENLKRVDARIKSGEANVLDLVARYGGDRVIVLGLKGGRT